MFKEDVAPRLLAREYRILFELCIHDIVRPLSRGLHRILCIFSGSLLRPIVWHRNSGRVAFVRSNCSSGPCHACTKIS